MGPRRTTPSTAKLRRLGIVAALLLGAPAAATAQGVAPVPVPAAHAVAAHAPAAHAPAAHAPAAHAPAAHAPAAHAPAAHAPAAHAPAAHAPAAHAPAPAAHAAAGLPRSPIGLGVGSAEGLAIRPHAIVYTGDGTGLIAGAKVQTKVGIRWTSWTASAALGTGSQLLNDCVPTCAAGKYHGYAVKIEQWRPRTLGGLSVFTRMTIWYTGPHPKGAAAHFTFTNLYVDKAYGWGPASRVGYCVDTQGQRPAPGCADIGALPPQ